MNKLGVRIQGQPFDHLIYHFVMTYSNWEWGTVCFSESFESLSVGFQSAVWKLGGVPKDHRTDRLSAAVHKEIHPEVFTQRYESLLAHYGVEGRRIQVSEAQRERRCRAEALPAERGGGPNTDVARQSRL